MNTPYMKKMISLDNSKFNGSCVQPLDTQPQLANFRRGGGTSIFQIIRIVSFYY